MVSFYGVRRSLGKFINSPEPRAHSPEPTAHLLRSYTLSSSPLGWVISELVTYFQPLLPPHCPRGMVLKPFCIPGHHTDA